MINKIKTFFQDNILADKEEGALATPTEAIQKATAALLVEIMVTDNLLDEREKVAIKTLLSTAFTLSSAESEELFSLAQSEVADSTSLYQFTGLVNQHFSADDKFELIKNMWHVAFADNELDKYEEGLIRQVSELIHLPHNQFIKAKSIVKAQL